MSILVSDSVFNWPRALKTSCIWSPHVVKGGLTKEYRPATDAATFQKSVFVNVVATLLYIVIEGAHIEDNLHWLQSLVSKYIKAKIPLLRLPV